MRAVYLNQNFSESLSFSVEEEKAHHLINVVRVKKREKILLINGLGVTAEGEILEITKKNVQIKVLKTMTHLRGNLIDLALIMPKKETFEDILRIATEIGIRKVYPILGENTPIDYETKNERISRILENSLEQSNNPFLLEINQKQAFTEFVNTNFNYDHSFIFDSSGVAANQLSKISGEILYFVGPEGGLSAYEVELLRTKYKNVVAFDTPILRAPQAVSFGAGLLTALLAN